MPLSWEGYAVVVAFLLGMFLLQLEADPIRRGIAGVLLMAGFCAVVVLTWGDPDGEVRGWRETLFNRQTLVWLAVLLVLGGAIAAASYVGCGGCYHKPAPYWRAGAVQSR
jgi:hypothetical protein